MIGTAVSPEAAKAPDFVGLGAQRAGTSWLYACLIEHPQIWMPRKEIHFFSRDRNWLRGYDWYESLFAASPPNVKTGEISTTYLDAEQTSKRIAARYPTVRLFASLRNPVDRAFSSYLNDIVAGNVPPSTGFWDALESRPQYIEQSMYARHLERFLNCFNREQLLFLVYEESTRNPLEFIQTIYRFVGVNGSFRPSMIERRVGWGRVPRLPRIDRLILKASAFMQTHGRTLRRAWWSAKRLGLGDLVRNINTQRDTAREKSLTSAERRLLFAHFEDDVNKLEDVLNRRLPLWRP
jgi:hypothetical protein